jgi:hypothetical protein
MNRKWLSGGMGIAIVAVCALALAAVPGFFSTVNVTTGFTVAGGAGTAGQALCSDGTYYDTPCGGGAVYYQTIDVAGTPQAQAPTLNLIGGTGINISCVLNTPIEGATNCTWSTAINSGQTNCLTTSCAGGSTYASGTTYTNGSAAAVTEEVVMQYENTGAPQGCEYELIALVNGVQVGNNGIHNDCQGAASTTFVVPPSATFSATVTHITGGSSPFVIANWVEVQ